ncbi:VRR-NUC domain-containing protein [Halomonas sp. WWR20]
MDVRTAFVAPMTLAPLEDPFYYLNNFQTVLGWVGARYPDLLSTQEADFIATFPALPRASRALLARMVMRKGTLFRAGKLDYVEIGAPRAAAQPLIDQGWVEADPVLTLEEVFGLLTKAEILQAFAVSLATGEKDSAGLKGAACLKKAASLKKAELLERLQPVFAVPRRFSAWWSTDDVYALTLMDMCDRLRLMFFGNLRQDWSDFVLADLGIYRYETVEFSPESRAFRRRTEVDTYLHLHHCRERFEAGEPLETILMTLPAIIDNPWLESRRAKLVFQLAQHCERHAELDTALALYADCLHPGARIRRLRVLERRGEHAAALALAREAEQAPESDGERQHLQRMLPRLHRKLGLPKPPRRASAPMARIDLTLPRVEVAPSVEGAVRMHLEETAGPVHYVENTLINSLFGLLCWQAIFAPLPGAFFHPFHAGPADLLRADFHQRRAALFEACLAELESDAYLATIRDNFATKEGLQSPFVHWGVLNETLLEQALACFPAHHLRLWFERLLEDIKANRAGMPDLIQFWPGRDPGQRYRMIEVKGPGDRLQDNQLRWLEFCAEHAMPVTVCYVQWAESAAEDHGS